MKFRQLIRPFSTKSILLLLVVLSFIIQVIVISYNHFSGYHVLEKIHYLFAGLVKGTLISALCGFFIAVINLSIIRALNRRLPWTHSFFDRVVCQVLLTIVVGVVISFFATGLSHIINPYSEELKDVILNNALIFSVVNILLMTILEGWIFFFESNHAKQVTGDLEYELAQVKFDILKSQINPHFMFDSLNILSELINEDVIKAQQFIDDFSMVYRYVAETFEKPVISLGREIDFIRSYINLHKIKYGDNLSLTLKVPGEYSDLMVPPLSLQAVVEYSVNSCKSEAISIEITSKKHTLIIKNKQPYNVNSNFENEAGLKNLTKRYAFLCNNHPLFNNIDGYFVAKLPLIDSYDENFNC